MATDGVVKGVNHLGLVSLLQYLYKHKTIMRWSYFYNGNPSLVRRRNYIETAPPVIHSVIGVDKSNHIIHFGDVIMGAIASLITSLIIVYSTVYSDADQRKHQSSASLACVWGIHRGPVNSPHKWPVTRKMFPLDDVIMLLYTPSHTGLQVSVCCLCGPTFICLYEHMGLISGLFRP